LGGGPNSSRTESLCGTTRATPSSDAGLKVVTTGIRTPRMNSLIERWIQTCRRELLDRTLIWNQSHLLHALREFEDFSNGHRPHRTLKQAAAFNPLPEPIHVPAQVRHLDIHRCCDHR
jgi:transposase InsO family protein